MKQHALVIPLQPISNPHKKPKYSDLYEFIKDARREPAAQHITESILLATEGYRIPRTHTKKFYLRALITPAVVFIGTIIAIGTGQSLVMSLSVSAVLMVFSLLAAGLTRFYQAYKPYSKTIRSLSEIYSLSNKHQESFNLMIRVHSQARSLVYMAGQNALTALVTKKFMEQPGEMVMIGGADQRNSTTTALEDGSIRVVQHFPSLYLRKAGATGWEKVSEDFQMTNTTTYHAGSSHPICLSVTHTIDDQRTQDLELSGICRQYLALTDTSIMSALNDKIGPDANALEVALDMSVELVRGDNGAALNLRTKPMETPHSVSETFGAGAGAGLLADEMVETDARALTEDCADHTHSTHPSASPKHIDEPA